MSKTLYEKSFEHDACGVGLVASIDGVRTNKVLKKAIEAVVNFYTYYIFCTALKLVVFIFQYFF